VVDYTAQMQAAYAAWLAREDGAWPRLRVVFAILAGGAPVQLERLASRGVDTRAILDPNVFLDTASYGARALELALATYGVGQLVYGSDAPVIETAPTLQSVRGFGQAVADAVCRDNPARLLR
jgi:predicted TIM-barrel fold metal-dependent hydrolase